MANSDLEAAVLYAMNHGFEKDAEYLVVRLRDERRDEVQKCHERWQNSSADQKQIHSIDRAPPSEHIFAHASVETDNLMVALANETRSSKDDLIEAAARYAIMRRLMDD